MKRITYFLSGALAALLISSATVSAFAAGGLITLNVQPAQVILFSPTTARPMHRFVRWLKHTV